MLESTRINLKNSGSYQFAFQDETFESGSPFEVPQSSYDISIPGVVEA